MNKTDIILKNIQNNRMCAFIRMNSRSTKGLCVGHNCTKCPFYNKITSELIFKFITENRNELNV